MLLKLARLLRSPFARDSALLQSSGMVVAGLQLVSTVVVANAIGETEQGVFFMAVALNSLLFMLFNTGVMQATVVQLATGAAEADVHHVASWQAFLLKVYLGAGVFLALLGGLVLPWAGETFLDDRRVGLLAWWLTALPILEFPRVLAQASFQAVRRMGELARLELLNEVFRVSAVIGGTLWLGDARGPVLGTILATALGSVWGTWLYRRLAHSSDFKLPSVGVILARVRAVPVLRGLGLGVRVGAMRALDALTLNILPPLFIGVAGTLLGRPPEASKDTAAYFRLAQRIIQVPIVLLQGISRTTLPALSQMAGRRDARGFRRAFFRVTLLSGLISAGGMGAVLLARPLLPLALDLLQLPASYHQPVSHLVGILAIGASTLGFSVAFEAFFLASGRLRTAIGIAVPAAIFGQALTFTLSYLLPATGTAWGISATYVVSQAFGVYILWFFRGDRYLALFGDPQRPPRAAGSPVN